MARAEGLSESASVSPAGRHLAGRHLAAVPSGPHASDEMLVERVHRGDELALDQLLLRYRGFTRAKARAYFLVGGDHEDIVQEGMIGLYKAVRDYRAEAGTTFRTFAELCVTRQIVTAIKAATRHKHAPLNTYVSFSRPVQDQGDERTLADVLPARVASDPADLVIAAERIRALQQHVDHALSDLEVQVLRLHLDGKSYQEIAAALDRHVKSVDNALQRVKRKLDLHLRGPELSAG